MPDLPRSTRRSLLLSAGATLALAACQPSSHPAKGPTPKSNAAVNHPGAVFVAHRGGGLDWPEMTVHAYQQAQQLPGISGMEVSVHRSRDGVLVCCHDEDTLRVTGTKMVIAQTDWDDLRTLKVWAKDTLEATQPAQPLARLEEVLEAWPAKLPVWAEPKSLDAVDPMMAMLSTHKDLGIVWKRPVNRDFTAARRRGWRTFGYVLQGEAQMKLLTDRAPLDNIDFVGVQSEQTDEKVRAIADFAKRYGRTALMWELRTVEQRDRALRLGCQALMCSDIRGLLQG